ncbi:MAG: diguanylate cyclase [Gallionellaceae bacterium]|nr:diguanylate cyclase [Gallionellaceae bacterium]
MFTATPPATMNPQLPRLMTRQLIAGFALLIVLMGGLIGHAVWHISDLKERMRDIVEQRFRKIQLATDLQEASYNRHSALVYQAVSRDAFERDDYFQQYIKWGYQVGLARSNLKSLPLDVFERNNLFRQDSLVGQIIDEQETISDLAARGLKEEALTRLATDLRPLNLGYTETVEALRRHERDLIRAALEQTQHATQNAITLHLTLGGVLILLAVLISETTRRLLRRHALTIFEQMHQLERAGTQLEHEATHDPLTGLANRVLFYRRLEEAMVHAAEEDFSLAVMYIDLDDFKQVNDVHGHAVGDALLQAVADRLHHVLRVADTAARLGGDEFALLFVGVQETSECPPLCAKVEKEIARPLEVEGLSLTPACSIGYALYPRDGRTLDTLLNTADARMYQVKRARKEGRAM